jgi:hypothetical protein
MTYSSPLPSSNYGWNVDAQNDLQITSTISGETTALDVNFINTQPFSISANTSANDVSNPIFTSLVQDGNTLVIDSNGAITTNSTLTVPESGILVTGSVEVSGTVAVTAPSSGLLVTGPEGGLEVVVNVPTSGLNVNVISAEDYKVRINDYQTTAVTKVSSASMTHDIIVDSNISTWTVGATTDCVFTLKAGATTLMKARTSAAQRQVQIMFPTAILATGDLTVEVSNTDKGDDADAFSVINGYEQ